MNLTFKIHDVSDYPVVRFLSEKMNPGFADDWCAEMDALIGNDEPHIMLFTGDEPEEAHEDRKKRGAWLKENKAGLAAKCLAFIIVVPDAERRRQLEAAFPNLKRAFGISQAACATEEEAVKLAQATLKAGRFEEGA